MTDLLIVGAGPAGMSAAIEAVKYGIHPIVVDNRPEPGGNIYAFLGSNKRKHPERIKIFGPDYAKGGALIDAFLTSVEEGRITYHSSARLWRIDPDGGYAFDGPDGSRAGKAEQIILATGAQERPMPLPGWTLPGVMGVGAAQILMKSGGELPAGDIVIVGAGPLPLLLADQLAKAGRPVKAMIEPAGASRLLNAAPHILQAAAAPKTALKGTLLLAKRILRRTSVWRNAKNIEIVGADTAAGVRFMRGKTAELDAACVLIHDGIIPNLNPLRAAGLELEYSEQQKTWHVQSSDVIHVAGDGAGILGVDAAIISGRTAAKRVCRADPVNSDEKAYKKQRSFRQFIDATYPPVQTAGKAKSDTVLCRCEMIRAGAVEAAIDTLGADPNAIKRALRIGMGPCQGRLCNHSLADYSGTKLNCSAKEVGLPRARNPVLPVSFETLAELEE
ncbi:NADPH-dependent 2,4-dienoyl-CoA reductase, sulfur reductase [Epibacterium ulvae]|uniref:NADPH-dependent 2,4-dienoyl-CoA reductase, sulfur reductase n=1 Tax=Epibacterium ulvae TaxID=1156985 RepID=A0A1G5RK85_9RHOB|nr:NAD(P)/FAD-dependent oxidoreductase [Epibacterium ulvae]SCZ74220.1 NADPH-dependent 2,4-dienoyl-CoA reductase, sulfur reductase [Epibacterium ulvae]